MALASRLGPTVTHQAQAAFTDGMQSALVCAAVVIALAAVTVAALLRHPSSQDAAMPEAGAGH